MGGYLDAYFDLFRAAAAAVARERMQAAADAIIDVVARDGTIFSCGNGGSAAIANHLACDCLKGVRTDTTIKPRVSSLSATVELITAIANDIGYDDIFSYQLSSLAKPGDVLITISSSGRVPQHRQGNHLGKGQRSANDLYDGVQGRRFGEGRGHQSSCRRA